MKDTRQDKKTKQKKKKILEVKPAEERRECRLQLDKKKKKKRSRETFPEQWLSE